MNAPEKIYVHEASASELTENLPYHIEYARTAAFIEKAVEWQRKELCNYFDAPREDFERFIEDFKKAMKQ